jgi:hypothetical protein
MQLSQRRRIVLSEFIYWRGMLKGHEWLASPTIGTPVAAGQKA